MSGKYGSFKVSVKNENNENVTHTVNPLSQQEIGNGWQLVLPKRKRVMKTVHNKDGEDVKIMKTNESFFKINLSQLPPHLFKNLKKVYKQYNYTHSQVRDNCYVYIVQPTPVDKEIETLFKYILKFEHTTPILNDEDRRLIRECLDKVNDTDLSGWVITKANRVF